MAAYGIDSLDPQVSTRRVHVLLERLPPWARTPGEAWSVEADLLALLVDHVANLTWITLRAYGAKNVTRPRPIPRPPRLLTPSRDGATAPGPAADRGPGKASSWMEAARMLAGMPGVVVKSDA
jgi:hypothetical protein